MGTNSCRKHFKYRKGTEASTLILELHHLDMFAMYQLQFHGSSEGTSEEE